MYWLCVGACMCGYVNGQNIAKTEFQKCQRVAWFYDLNLLTFIYLSVPSSVPVPVRLGIRHRATYPRPIRTRPESIDACFLGRPSCAARAACRHEFAGLDCGWWSNWRLAIYVNRNYWQSKHATWRSGVHLGWLLAAQWLGCASKKKAQRCGVRLTVKLGRQVFPQARVAIPFVSTAPNRSKGVRQHVWWCPHKNLKLVYAVRM